MKKFSCLIILCSCTIFVPSLAAAAPCNPATSATSCIGDLCAQVGATIANASVTDLLACLYTDSTQTEKRWKPMSTGAVAGAVMAFNLSACPVGWAALPAANGRTIIGTGTSTAAGATAHTLGQTGGEETHTLTTAELPSHSHATHWLVHNEHGASSYGAFASGNSNAPEGDYFTEPTEASGSGTAFNTMPAYLSLLYCYKL